MESNGITSRASRYGQYFKKIRDFSFIFSLCLKLHCIGTGKTTICKALAQKSFIRNSTRFPSGGMLLEINSHSLFSKWFSESGKLVMKLFQHISDLADDDECMVNLYHICLYYHQ